MPDLERIGIHLSPTAAPDRSAATTLLPGRGFSGNAQLFSSTPGERQTSGPRDPYATLHRMVTELRLNAESPHEPEPPVTLGKPERPILSETDVAIQDQARIAITGLKSKFPSGLHFPELVFYCTGKRVTDQYGRPGMRIAIVDKAGSMTMAEAYEQNDYEDYTEWDLVTAKPVPITSVDIRCYAIPLLDTMLMRLTKVKLPDALKSRNTKTIRNIREDLARIRNARQAISDLLTGGIAEPAQPTEPAK
jgi:hypothetical protein